MSTGTTDYYSGRNAPTLDFGSVLSFYVFCVAFVAQAQLISQNACAFYEQNGGYNIHRIHNGAQNHQVEAGQASSFKFCKFASF